jgi:DNA invertase Pin-like site-specific DNA recombinase
MSVCYGYLRVSTLAQDIENNRNWILRKANDLKIGPVIFIEEKVSGKKDWKKRELGKLFEKLNKGDKIITFEYSRLGRDFKQTMEFLSCCDRKGVKIYGGDIENDGSLESNLQVFIASVTSQKERENISRRTKEALKKKKEEGVILGRKKDKMILEKKPNNIIDIKNLIENGTKLYVIAQKYETTPLTLSKFIKKHNLKK